MAALRTSQGGTPRGGQEGGRRSRRRRYASTCVCFARGRFWTADSYRDRFDAGQEPESLDKEFLRLWVVSRCDPYREPIPDIPVEILIEFSDKYVGLFERVTGLAFEVPDAGTPVRERVRRALATELPAYF